MNFNKYFDSLFKTGNNFVEISSNQMVTIESLGFFSCGKMSETSITFQVMTQNAKVLLIGLYIHNPTIVLQVEVGIEYVTSYQNNLGSMSIILDEFTGDTPDAWNELTVDFCYVEGKKPHVDHNFKVIMKFTTFSDGYLKLDNIGKTLTSLTTLKLSLKKNILGPCPLLYGLERSMTLAYSNKRRCYRTFIRTGNYKEVI